MVSPVSGVIRTTNQTKGTKSYQPITVEPVSHFFTFLFRIFFTHCKRASHRRRKVFGTCKQTGYVSKCIWCFFINDLSNHFRAPKSLFFHGPPPSNGPRKGFSRIILTTGTLTVILVVTQTAQSTNFCSLKNSVEVALNDVDSIVLL